MSRIVIEHSLYTFFFFIPFFSNIVKQILQYGMA